MARVAREVGMEQADVVPRPETGLPHGGIPARQLSVLSAPLGNRHNSAAHGLHLHHYTTASRLPLQPCPDLKFYEHSYVD